MVGAPERERERVSERKSARVCERDGRRWVGCNGRRASESGRAAHSRYGPQWVGWVDQVRPTVGGLHWSACDRSGSAGDGGMVRGDG